MTQGTTGNTARQVQWHCMRFNALEQTRLYEILALRQRVFVVEQNCAYQDIDGLDLTAQHLFAVNNHDALLAYTRLLPPADDGYSRIGRVVVAPEARGTDLGKTLMRRAIARNLDEWPDATIHIGAQAYLTRFYSELGFVRCGEDYDEDGIPHLPMVYQGV